MKMKRKRMKKNRNNLRQRHFYIKSTYKYKNLKNYPGGICPTM